MSALVLVVLLVWTGYATQTWSKWRTLAKRWERIAADWERSYRDADKVSDDLLALTKTQAADLEEARIAHEEWGATLRQAHDEIKRLRTTYEPEKWS
jgi:hypothetical protein